VHQGDFDGVTGVYHIHGVEDVTQWQVGDAAPRIAELERIPVLEAILGLGGGQERGRGWQALGL
jgi:hypothetical protein